MLHYPSKSLVMDNQRGRLSTARRVKWSVFSWFILKLANAHPTLYAGLLIFLLLPSDLAGYHGDSRLLWRITAYVSLLTNLIVSPTLIIHILRSKKELDSVLAPTRTNQSPYKRIIEILIEAAFPPLLSGIVHIILFAGFKTQAIVLNMILLSFTV
jgi:ABC-type tungstate transport system substrate-binding protein